MIMIFWTSRIRFLPTMHSDLKFKNRRDIRKVKQYAERRSAWARDLGVATSHCTSTVQVRTQKKSARPPTLPRVNIHLTLIVLLPQVVSRPVRPSKRCTLIHCNDIQLLAALIVRGLDPHIDFHITVHMSSISDVARRGSKFGGAWS